MKRILMLGVLGFSALANAEIVTNSKGEKIELKANGTWVKATGGTVKATNYTDSQKEISDGDTVLVLVKDGNDKEIELSVKVRVEGDVTRKLKKSDVVGAVTFTVFKTKLYLKNKYSYQPKSALVTQSKDTLDVFIEHVAQNSYGADTVGHGLEKFKLDDKNYYAPVR